MTKTSPLSNFGLALCTKIQRQAWCNLQVKLCDLCLSAFEALCVKMRNTNRRVLYFTLLAYWWASDSASEKKTGARYPGGHAVSARRPVVQVEHEDREDDRQRAHHHYACKVHPCCHGNNINVAAPRTRWTNNITSETEISLWPCHTSCARCALRAARFSRGGTERMELATVDCQKQELSRTV